ncbi:MAG: hypothetical protein P4M08_02385 [Oligoflexia bacterium]|nr:hypothetical protein [Oligoflexia bacterium]
MPVQITNTTQSLWAGLTSSFTSFMNFMPALLGGIVVLVVGWLIAKFVARLVRNVLVATKFEHAVAKSQVADYLPQTRTGVKASLSGIIATMAKWFVFLIFIQAAANILQMAQVTAIINSIVLFIPNLVVALAILVIGAMAARFVGDLVESSTLKMGVARPKAFSLISRYAIVGFAVIAAVNQLGIATNLINILFTGLVASLALASGLAFGLGGQGVASEITRSWYEQGKAVGPQLRSVEGGEKKQKA